MNSFVNSGLSLHLAVCQLVTMPALLPLSAQPSAKEIRLIAHFAGRNHSQGPINTDALIVQATFSNKSTFEIAL